ncbi:Tyrosine--tRNA ligase [Rickettsiales bacterium Ac37b]|nr:Tyrosine--tRNA ligase [Rickettsiales bacterium Ac37b]
MTLNLSPLLKAFKERGFFYQCTNLDNLNTLTLNDKIVAYLGFDCTAPSLHVGSLMQIMILRLLQSYGHKPVILLGGGTTKIGDPSFKSEERKLLGNEEIAQNMQGIKNVLEKFIDFDDKQNGAIVVNNADWLDQLNYMNFLRDYGRYFSVNRMLSFDSVKLRLEREQNLSFLEFNYMLLQAYDFVQLNKTHNCRLQIGGSDQWGNIVNGVELGKKLGLPELYGLTTPLVTTADGNKMGKTVKGAIWLSADLLSPYDYYQFWRNVVDEDIVRFLYLFTELDPNTINQLAQLQGSEINEAKKILAFEATKLCHGIGKAEIASQTAEQVFIDKQTAHTLPSIEITSEQLTQGIPAFELFLLAKLSNSGGEARRLIRGKGAKLNDQVIESELYTITSKDLQKDNIIKLSAGKKNHILVRVVD